MTLLFRLAAAFCFLALGGCLSPVPVSSFGTAEKSTYFLSRISVEPIEDREGQILRAELERRLNSEQSRRSKNLVLSVRLEIVSDSAYFSSKRTLGHVLAKARYELHERKSAHRSSTPVTQGTLTERSDYAAGLSAFSRESAERDALEQALNRLAEEIVLRLRLYFFDEQQQVKSSSRGES